MLCSSAWKLVSGENLETGLISCMHYGKFGKVFMVEVSDWSNQTLCTLIQFCQLQLSSYWFLCAISKFRHRKRLPSQKVLSQKNHTEIIKECIPNPNPNTRWDFYLSFKFTLTISAHCLWTLYTADCFPQSFYVYDCSQLCRVIYCSSILYVLPVFVTHHCLFNLSFIIETRHM